MVRRRRWRTSQVHVRGCRAREKRRPGQRSPCPPARASRGGQNLAALDGPRIALTAIHIGPALMLFGVVLVMALLSPVFLTTTQRR